MFRSFRDYAYWRHLSTVYRRNCERPKETCSSGVMGMVSSLNLFCPGVIETYSWTGEQVRFSRSHAQRSQYGPRRRWGVQQLAQTAPVP